MSQTGAFWIPTGGAGGGGTFLGLSDVLTDTYTGYKGCVPMVNPGETGLVFGLRAFPVEMFGAVGDAQFKNDGAMSSGSSTVTASTSSPFVPGDLGKALVIPGAGMAGAQLQGTISAYMSPSQVQLSVNASTTVSGQRFTWGTDNTTAIQSALDAAKAVKGGRAVCRTGTPYLVTGQLNMQPAPAEAAARYPVALSGEVQGPCAPYNFSLNHPMLFITNITTPAIKMGFNCHVRDLVFFYPTQMPITDVVMDAVQPRVFPMTISMCGFCTIERNTFINAYDAIGCYQSYGGTGHTSRILNNNIGAFNKGIALDFTRDVCYVENNHNWVFYNIFEGFWQAFTDQSRWSNFTPDGPCAMEVLGADQVMISNLFSLGKHTGLRLAQSGVGQGGLEMSYGEGNNLHFDLACVGIDVKRTSTPGWRLTNVGWTGGDTGGVGGVPPAEGGSPTDQNYYLVRISGSSKLSIMGGTGGMSRTPVGTSNPLWMVSKASASELWMDGLVNFNPIGPISSPPSIPASNVAYKHNYPVKCRVYVAGGTVTDIKINGTSTGMTSGGFVIAPTETITLTYSSAPTWTWFGL